MNKKINLSVSSFLLAGFFVSGCSQQQISAGGSQQTAGGQQIYANSGASSDPGNVVVDSLGNPVKDGTGRTVRSTHTAINRAGADVQTAPLVKPSAIDQQVQNIVVPKPHYTPKVHTHSVKPTQTRHYRPKPVHKMVKPVQRMAKPVQRRSVAYTKSSSGMPPAKPNQCYAKVRTGPTFKNAVKRVQVSPAVNKRVLVRAPQYVFTHKRVQVRPATHTYRYIPAQYRNVSKRVLVKPAHYAWQKGKKGPVMRIDNMTGEILCRVKVPAVYRTVVQKVMARPGQRVKKHIPAVYRTVKQKQLASPAQYRNVHRPARFVNKTYHVQTGGTGYRWQPINC